MGAREERIGKNEALFREVNERITEVTQGLADDAEAAEFLCECGDEACTRTLELSLAAYEELRADATTFAVVAGHEQPDVESVVSRHGGYVVVRKHPGKPTAIAEQTDPR